MQDQQNDAASIAAPTSPASIGVQPVTPERWDDLVALFETSPVTSSCWCVSPRVRASEFSRFGAAARQRDPEMMHHLVAPARFRGCWRTSTGDPPAGSVWASERCLCGCGARARPCRLPTIGRYGRSFAFIHSACTGGRELPGR